MNPYDERRLIDEVIFLHSLWHKGPPHPTPTPLPNTLPVPIPAHDSIAYGSEPYIPQPLAPLHLHRHHRQPTISPISTQAFAPARTRVLPPTSSTVFKNKKKNKNKRKDPTNNNIEQSDKPQSPGWPCSASTDPPATSWRKPKQLRSEAPAVSPQEKERLALLQVQNKACQAFRKFLLDNGDDFDDDDEADDEADDDEWDEFEGFFVRIFMEDDGLRNYYQRCFESGEFRCLVCDAIGKKNSGKKFKGCVGLVQHSMSISRTVKKQAHRAFGEVVCKVLGWDIDRLPTIVMKGEPLGFSMKIKPSETEVTCPNVANSVIND